MMHANIQGTVDLMNQFTNAAFEALVMSDIKGDDAKREFVNNYVDKCCELHKQGAFEENSESVPDEDLELVRYI